MSYPIGPKHDDDSIDLHALLGAGEQHFVDGCVGAQPGTGAEPVLGFA